VGVNPGTLAYKEGKDILNAAFWMQLEYVRMCYLYNGNPSHYLLAAVGSQKAPPGRVPWSKP